MTAQLSGDHKIFCHLLSGGQANHGMLSQASSKHFLTESTVLKVCVPVALLSNRYRSHRSVTL